MATTSPKLHTFRGGDYVAALMAELSRAAIAQRIAQARDQAGLTQAELADLLGVHFRTVQDWESVKKETTPWDRLGEIADVTGVSRNWLLHGAEEVAVADGETIVDRLLALEAAVVALSAAVHERVLPDLAAARTPPGQPEEAEAPQEQRAHSPQ